MGSSYEFHLKCVLQHGVFVCSGGVSNCIILTVSGCGCSSPYQTMAFHLKIVTGSLDNLESLLSVYKEKHLVNA